jgi:hypothetical protein
VTVSSWTGVPSGTKEKTHGVDLIMPTRARDRFEVRLIARTRAIHLISNGSSGVDRREITV